MYISSTLSYANHRSNGRLTIYNRVGRGSERRYGKDTHYRSVPLDDDINKMTRVYGDGTRNLRTKINRNRRLYHGGLVPNLTRNGRHSRSRGKFSNQGSSLPRSTRKTDTVSHDDLIRVFKRSVSRTKSRGGIDHLTTNGRRYRARRVLNRSRPTRRDVREVRHRQAGQSRRARRVYHESRLFTRGVSTTSRVNHRKENSRYGRRHRRYRCRTIRRVLTRIRLLRDVGVIIRLPILQRRVSTRYRFYINLRKTRRDMSRQVGNGSARKACGRPFRSLTSRMGRVVSFFQKTRVQPFWFFPYRFPFLLVRQSLHPTT